MYLVFRVATIFTVFSQNVTVAGEHISNQHSADRLELIKATIEHSLNWQFFWGHGLDSFAADIVDFKGPWQAGDGMGTKMSAHNLFVQVLYEQGLFGILLIFGGAAWLIFKLYKSDGGILRFGFIFSLFALAVNSNTDPSVLIERLTWVILGMALSYLRLSNTTKKSVEEL